MSIRKRTEPASEPLGLSTIHALQRLETTSYYCDHDEHAQAKSKGRGLSSEEVVAEDFRNEMSAWYLDIASIYEIKLDTIEVALSCFDRFLSVRSEVLLDPSIAQLAGTTALYIAAKIREKEPLPLAQALYLSQTPFSEKYVEEMERIILDSIRWRVNPPTTMEFVHHLLLPDNDLIPPSLRLDKAQLDTIMDVVSLQVQLSLCDGYFASIRPSTVAFGALMNAFKTVFQGQEYADSIHSVRNNFLVFLRLDSESVQESLGEIQLRLYDLVVGTAKLKNSHGECDPRNKDPLSAHKPPSIGDSPRSITITSSKLF